MLLLLFLLSIEKPSDEKYIKHVQIYTCGWDKFEQDPRDLSRYIFIRTSWGYHIG